MAHRRRTQLTADTTQLAKFLDITPRHVRRMKADGILVLARDADGAELRGRYELLPNNIAYIRYLRRKASPDDASENQYQALRNQRMAAEAEHATLDLRLYKQQLHRADDTEFVVGNMVEAAKARILKIPRRVTKLILGLTDFQKIYDLIYAEIEAALRELASYNRKMFTRENREYVKAAGANGEASS
jgi:hypothetical protein